MRANGQVVSYKEGGRMNVPFNVAYQPGMEKSELFLDFNATVTVRCMSFLV